MITKIIVLFLASFITFGANATEWKIDPKNGLLNTARFYSSPNFDARPTDHPIDLIVIHNISLPAGEFRSRYVHDLFMNQLNTSHHPSFKSLKRLKVSTHLFIRRNGEIWQFVPFHRRAWHAGRSLFNGISECNNYSIGIELEGTDDIPYTIAQYQALTHSINAIMKRYPQIKLNRIVGHNEIAPGRKTDPGHSFNWLFFYYLLNQHLSVHTSLYEDHL